LWLFPPPRPLVERFGVPFFRGVPKQPGVYFFFDAAGRLIYIGKAKNLHQRLGSYRHAHPERDSRKTWRLVNAVHAIEWRICESHEAAVLLENRLLREHRPRFNRANVWPWSAVYIGLRAEGDRLHLRLDRELDEQHRWFGAYQAFAIRSFAALRRLLHQRYGDPAAPLQWFARDTVRRFSVPSHRLDVRQLEQFLEGRSSAFLSGFEEQADRLGQAPLASQNLILNDLILLEEFYERGARRRRMILDAAPESPDRVSPEQLVDWLALQATAGQAVIGNR